MYTYFVILFFYLSFIILSCFPTKILMKIPFLVLCAQRMSFVMFIETTQILMKIPFLVLCAQRMSFVMFIETTKIHHGSIYIVCKKKLINCTKGYDSTHIENSHSSKF
jgi:hypothetical protein